MSNFLITNYYIKIGEVTKMPNWKDAYWEETTTLQDDIKRQLLVYAVPVSAYERKNRELMASVMLTRKENVLVSYIHNDARKSKEIANVIQKAKKAIEPVRVIGIEHFEITDPDVLDTTFYVRLKASIKQQKMMEECYGTSVNREDFGCIVDYDGHRKTFSLVPFSSDKEQYTLFYQTAFQKKEWFDGAISKAFEESLLKVCKEVMEKIIKAKREPHRYYLRDSGPITEGSFPLLEDNKILGFRDFEGCLFQTDVGEWLHGYVEYQKPLEPSLAEEYHLSYREPAMIGNDGQEYRIRFGYFGNGLSVINQYELSGTRGIIAHIGEEGTVRLYLDNIPDSILEKINTEAHKLRETYQLREERKNILTQIRSAETKKQDSSVIKEENSIYHYPLNIR